jgi:hypothetical protein
MLSMAAACSTESVRLSSVIGTFLVDLTGSLCRQGVDLDSAMTSAIRGELD